MEISVRKLLEDQQQEAVNHHPEDFHLLHFFRETLEHLLHAFAHAFDFLHHPHFPPQSLHHWLSLSLTAVLPVALVLLLAYCCCCGGHLHGARWMNGAPGRPWGHFHRPGSFWADPRGYFRNFRFRTRKDPSLF